MHRGYVKVWRKIEDSGLFGNAELCRLFLYLLIRATHARHKLLAGTQVVELEPGQFFAGRKQLAAALRSTEQRIRTALKTLEKMGVINHLPGSRGSVISIVNWGTYQNEVSGRNRQGYSRSTGRSPAPGQRPTTKQEQPTEKAQEMNTVFPVSWALRQTDALSVPGGTEYTCSGDSARLNKTAASGLDCGSCTGAAAFCSGQSSVSPLRNAGQKTGAEMSHGRKPAESHLPRIVTHRRRLLTGKRLEAFTAFWEEFADKRGKAEAADAWLDIPELTVPLVERILAAAKAYAAERESILRRNGTPKMAQGWIKARRWEDYSPVSSGWHSAPDLDSLLVSKGIDPKTGRGIVNHGQAGYAQSGAGHLSGL